MLISATCPCGNTDVKQFLEYDGGMGYEAVVCNVCGDYDDHEGHHPADEWSADFRVQVRQGQRT